MMQTKRWDIALDLDNQNSLEPQDFIRLLLENRGITADLQEFLSPKYPDGYPLEELNIDRSQVDLFCQRLVSAREKNEKIIVFGDYDVDGVTATALMWKFLYDELKLAVKPYIPNRFEEGYGLSIKALEKIIELEKPELIITVDNGIVAHDAVEFATKNNIDVLVTDHHEKKEAVPSAFAIVHTTQTSGSALVWRLIQELRKMLGVNTSDNLLELAAIGTVADQLPLVGFNRSLVSHGLSALRNTKSAGIKALCEKTATTLHDADTYHINFIIAPKINAAGRLGNAMNALRLLCTNDPQKADELSVDLIQTNVKRQEVLENMFSLVETQLSENPSELPLIIVGSEEFHEGVIGLAASKVVESHGKPVILYSHNGVVAKASARSVQGFNIIEAIRSNEELIIEGGGHEMAAGFSILLSNMPQFIETLQTYAKDYLSGENLVPKLSVDALVPFSFLSWELSNTVKQLAPFGSGNKEPLFATKNVSVKEAREVGSGAKTHLKLKLSDGTQFFDAIWFGNGSMIDEVQNHEFINVAYFFEVNAYQGRESLQLRVKDVQFELNEPGI